MASSINASLTAGLVQTADTSGIINLQSNGATVAQVTSTGVAVTGTVTATNLQGPAFSAYPSASQSLSNITYTKIQFNTEEFDTNSCYDNATNYRFTPTVAGYYQVNAAVGFISSSTIRVGLATIYKNGSAFKQGEYAVPPTTNDAGACSGIVSALVYLNGTTDYVELYGWAQVLSGSLSTQNNANASYFQACLVRSA